MKQSRLSLRDHLHYALIDFAVAVSCVGVAFGAGYVLAQAFR